MKGDNTEGNSPVGCLASRYTNSYPVTTTLLLSMRLAGRSPRLSKREPRASTTETQSGSCSSRVGSDHLFEPVRYQYVSSPVSPFLVY